MIGLGAMGRGMAASLLRAGYTVQGYDVMPKAVETFLRYEGNSVGTTSPTEALKDAEVVVIMVQSAAQVDDVLFGKEEAIHGVRDGAVIIISSTVSPSYIRKLLDRIESLGRGLSVLDAPVSGGAARAANGTLTVRTPIFRFTATLTVGRSCIQATSPQSGKFDLLCCPWRGTH